MQKNTTTQHEPTIYPPVSPKDSIGQKLHRYADTWRILIIILFMLAGIIIGLVVGTGGGELIMGAMFGFFGWALGYILAGNITIFIEAQAELLINTAKIQEDLDFLCKVKEDELAAQEQSVGQPPSQ